MTIYTLYYVGQILGEAVSISLHPPKGIERQAIPCIRPTLEQRKVVEKVIE